MIDSTSRRTARTAQWEVFKDRKGWRFRLRAANAKLICTAGESFTRRRDAVRAVKRVSAVSMATTAITIDGGTYTATVA